ncbi:Neogenin, partial [Geodia barretti]
FFYRTEPLASNSSAEVQLLRNAFSIAEGDCDGLFLVVTISVPDDGEYQCRGNIPGSASPPVVSVIRELVVLDPDALVMVPPVQYAVSGTSHTLQCEVENQNAIIYWMEPGVPFDDKEAGSYVIDGATLEDEGEYTCVVYFSKADVFTQMTVQLYVVVPPSITHSLPTDPVNRNRNEPLSFTIEFNSRFEANTTVTWFHDNDVIRNGITTQFTSEYEGRSTLDLGIVSRSDRGSYRVEVYNNFSNISETQRKVRSSVDLSVTISPVEPTEVKAQNLSPNKVQLSWALPYTHNDQQPSSITILLTNLTDSSLIETTLPGSPTNLVLDVVPGTRYRAVLIANNEDGEMSTLPIRFRATPAPPKVTSVVSHRLNMTSFNISVTMDYTGGETISHFDVKFRPRNSSQWSNGQKVKVQDGGRMEMGLLWYGIVTNYSLGKPSELSVEVVNDANERSSSLTKAEVLAPLSAPSTPALLSSSHDSLTLSFHLPSEGTPPVLHIIVNFSSPSHFQWECRGVEDRALGDQLDCTVPRLTSDTQYTLAVFGLGHAGRGNTSQEVSFSTTSVDNSLPTWVIVVVTLVIAMTVLIVLLAAILVLIHCCKLRQKKRKYKFNRRATLGQTAPKPLEPSHAILNRNPPAHMGISRLSEMAPPPISPPSTVTPPLCRSTPSTTVTFKFETASGSSCSNLDSDISDVHSPSYSYRVTPPPPPSTCPSTIQSQQSYHSLGRSSHTHQSLHSTRDSLSSYPPAPAHCATNV